MRRALLSIAVVAALITAANNGVFAQKAFSRGAAPHAAIGTAPSPAGRGGDYRGGFRPHGPGLIVTIPGGPRYIDDGHDGGPQGPPSQRRAARRGSGTPAAAERRLVPEEVLIEVANSASAQTINALQRRHRLTQVEQQNFQLAGTTVYRWRIPDRRSVANVVRSLQAETAVASAQPNYLFTLQDERRPQDEARPPNARWTRWIIAECCADRRPPRGRRLR